MAPTCGISDSPQIESAELPWGGTNGKGVKDIALKGKAAKKYLDIAYNEVWKVFKAKAPENYEALKKLLYVEDKPNMLPLR